VGEADQTAAAERQKKKTKNKTLPTGQPPGKTKTEILLKNQH
jgi:hypothetical protein